MGKTNKVLLLLLLTFFAFKANSTCTLRYTNYIRSTGSFGSDIVKKVPKYTPLLIINETEQWYKVEGYNFAGWIHKKLVDTDMKCIIPENIKELDCPGYNLERQHPFTKNEGFKILSNEIGCSRVLDKYGNKLMIFTGNVWPQEYVKNIEI